MLMMWLETDFGELPKLIDFQLVKIYYLTFKRKKKYIELRMYKNTYIKSSLKGALKKWGNRSLISK